MSNALYGVETATFETITEIYDPGQNRLYSFLSFTLLENAEMTFRA